ncbi:MAG: hypothetical protein ABJO36_13080 [Litorimonas sp.]
MQMIIKYASLIPVILLAGCVTPMTADNFKPKPPSVSAENSPIVGTVGYRLRTSGVSTTGSTTKGNWEMGNYFGTWSTKGSSSDVFIRKIHKSKTTFTLNGGGFTQTLSAECKGRSHKSDWDWYSLKPNDLKYVCEFDDQTTKFEVVLENKNSVIGALINSRVGQIRHDGSELRLEEREVSGPNYKASDNDGYLFEAAGKTVAAFDYRDRDNEPETYSYDHFDVFLPPENDPNHKAAVVAAIALAFFDDPKRRNKCSAGDDMPDYKARRC